MAGRSNRNIGGLAARRRRNVWVGSIASLLVIAGCVAAALLVLKPWTPEFRHGGVTIAAPPAPVTLFPHVVSAPLHGPTISPPALTAALAPMVNNPGLGVFAGSVADGSTGTVLWSADPDKPMIPSSTAKVLTTAAALLVLPPDHRVTTRVVAGAASNEMVLVGGGDPTLTTQPDGKGYYPNGPRLSDLAAQVRASGRVADTVLVDISRYTGPTMAPGWDPIDIREGSIAPIEPVMIDGGRLDPLTEYSPRTATPALDVGRRLAVELGLDPTRVRIGRAGPDAEEIARVQSAPLRDRLRDMMVHSDNVLAETIGREVADATGGEQNFGAAVTATTTALHAAGFDLSGTTMRDSSGLSVDDRIPARVLNRILTVAAQPDDARARRNSIAGTATVPSSPLAPMLDYLPVAGATGSLSSRYTGPDRTGAGWVRAKTGTLSVSSALVGYVLDSNGRVLTFALMSNDRPPESSRPALDAIAATLRNCGCS